MRRLTPLAVAALIVAIGALAYGWSVWGNGFLVFRGGGETVDVAATDADSEQTVSEQTVSEQTGDSMVGVVSRESAPPATTEITDAVSTADLDTELAGMDEPAPVQSPASPAPDESPTTESSAAALEPATGPNDDKMAVAALEETAASAPSGSQETLHADDDPGKATADPECPLPGTGNVAPGDSACVAIADAEAEAAANVATPATVAEDTTLTESRRIAALTAPESESATAPSVSDALVTAARDAPDTVAIRAPQLRDQAVDNPADAIAPTFDVVRVAPGGSAVIAGRAVPGAEISVVDRDIVVGSAVADARGEWVVVSDLPLPTGPSEIGLVSRSAGGVESQSEQVVVLLVPEESAALAPAEQPVAVLMARSGGGEVRLLQGRVPGGGIAAPEELRLEAVSYDEAGDFDISGTAIPGNTIAAYLDNRPIGTAPVDTEGKWRLLPDKVIDPGLYTLRIDQIDKSGLVVSRLETPFSIADLTTAAVAEGLVVVQPGNSLWRIARRIYGAGVQHTVIFDANTDQIRDPDLIYPGQIFIVPGESSDG